MFEYIVNTRPGFKARHNTRSVTVNIDRAVLTLAGGMVLVSVGLAWLVNPYWLFLTAFVGANMLQASFTGWCPAALIFRSLGMKRGPAFQ
jgi:hypothetical protein